MAKDKSTNDIRIGKADVEKIALGQGIFLYHLSDRFFINQWDSEIGELWAEIHPGRNITLGEREFSIPPALFLKEKITLEAQDLFYSINDRTGLKFYKRILSNHIYFKAESGTMTAIVGRSGTGKTILLNLLSGYTYLKQAEGHIFLNEKIDVHRNRRYLGRIFGYVPRYDTLPPYLTVQESLESTFQLRYGKVEDKLRLHIIKDTCQKVGFHKDEIEKLLHTRIGFPEISFPESKTLSGGERKRINIAHELIRSPLILFLDEPTSGLSTIDAVQVINALKNLCITTDITIISTIHEPNEYIFNQFDKIFVLIQGGNTAYLGTSHDAIEYFQNKTNIEHKHVQISNEFIFESLDRWMSQLNASGNPNPEEIIAETFKNELSYLKTEIKPPSYVKDTETQKFPRLSSSFLQQVQTLLKRNFLIERANTKDRLFRLLQTLILALLIIIAFSWYAQDFYDENILSKVNYYITEKLDHGESISISKDLPEAKKWAYSTTTFIGVESAKYRATIFFLLIAASIWFGITSSCKEIVSERAVLMRDAKGTLRISSYLSSKVIFLGWICFKQTTLFLAVIFLPNLLTIPLSITQELFPESWIVIQNFLLNAQLLPDVNISYVIGIWAILSCTSLFASWLGLLISALAPTQSTVLVVISLVMIPQVLFGGLIRPIKNIDKWERFMITQQTLLELRTLHVSDEILEQLKAMINQQFSEKEEFLLMIKMTIGERDTPQLSELLIKYAKTQHKNFFAVYYNLMLQKWAFQVILIYDSFSEIKVLQKTLDVNQYDMFNFTRYNIVSLSNLFFNINIDNPKQARKILFDTLLGMILSHIVVLVVPTYLWLRQKLLET